MTNFDKLKEEIKDMTPEEFSMHCDQYVCGKISFKRCDKYGNDCRKCKIEFLKSEVN